MTERLNGESSDVVGSNDLAAISAEPPGSDPAPRVRLPPWPVRLIAAWEVAAGITLAGVVLWAAGHGTTLPLWFSFLVESVVFTSIAGGVALWKGEPPGVLLSCMLQFFQIVQVASRRFTFGLLLGPMVAGVVPAAGPSSLGAALRATLTVSVGDGHADIHPGVIVNFVATAALVVLLRYQRQTRRPWIRPRASRQPWDLMRVVGAYQIGAGGLGVLNSMYASAYAMGNLLFSMVVIASGAALMRRARWSDGIAVAVNAIQIPVFAISQWEFLLRSGASLVIAVAWGAHAGAVVHLDVGAVINGPLGSITDSFAGVNIIAAGLVVALANAPDTGQIQRQDAPVRSGPEAVS
jgi:hypothetical protein